MAIHPTGTCFDDVLDHQDYLLRVDPDRVQRQHIVHGICLYPEGPKIGTPYAHAWVEDDSEDRVYQSGLIDGVKVWYGVDRSEWYAAMRVQEKTRYTWTEALLQNWISNHYGPWVPAYRDLCL